MVDIAIVYEGDDITADVELAGARFVTQAGGDPGECSFRVRDKTHLYQAGYFRVGGELELYIDGRREWDGWVMGVGREWPFDVVNTENPSTVARWWAITGADRNVLFRRRYHLDKANPANLKIGDYPADTSDQFVVLDMLANYTTLEEDGLDLVSGIEEVGPIDPFLPLNLFSAGEQWYEAMRRTAQFNGAVYYIDPDRVVKYVDDQTATAPFALSDEPEPGEIGYRECWIRFNATDMYNEAFIWGTGIGSEWPAFAHVYDSNAIEDHGLFQYGEIFRGMWKYESVYRRGDVIINGSPYHHRGHKEDKIRITCAIFEPGLRVGDGVPFHAGAWDFGANDFGDFTDGPGTPPAGSEFEQLLYQIGRVESHHNYDAFNRHSGAMGYYQIMPSNWEAWSKRVFGLDASQVEASKNLPVSQWLPPTTPSNQEAVARWRIGKMYNNWGDPRRVAAAWRSGVSVAIREPSTWSNGTLLYVNHVCVPLGYDPVTRATSLDPTPADSISNVESADSRNDWQENRSADDVYPLRKMEMTFPTPTSVRFDLTLGHDLDAAWGSVDPPKPETPQPPGPTTEYTDQYPIPTGTYGTYPPIFIPSDTLMVVEPSWGVRRNPFGIELTDGANTLLPPGAVYSTIGIVGGTVSILPWFETTCGVGVGGWTNWEDSQAWYTVDANLEHLNANYPLEVQLYDPDNDAFPYIQGYVPGLYLNTSNVAPSIVGYLDGGQWLFSNFYESAYTTEPTSPTGKEAHFTSVIIPRGTLKAGTWLTLGPSWLAQRLQAGAYLCDVSYYDPSSVCSGEGPRCTGQGLSGMFTTGTIIGPSMRFVPVIGPNDWYVWPSSGVDNGPAAWWGYTFRTTYPYKPGTLEVYWQGVRLTNGVDYIEVSPSQGIFTVNELASGEGYITVKYIVASAIPTSPLPGEPNYVGCGDAEEVVAEARSMLGTPYVLGAESRSATDCSGLVFRAFVDSGNGSLIEGKRLLAAGYQRFFANRGYFTRDISRARRGDLITYWNGSRISHIAIYLGDGRCISACKPPWGVIIHRLNLTGLTTYGVCLVPYESCTEQTGTDPAVGSDSDPEDPQDPGADLPPQDDTMSAGRIYRPRPQTQFGWGTLYDGYNSIMAASAMALDRHTMGGYSDLRGDPLSTAPNHRLYSGVTAERSASLSDAATAWTEGWARTLALPGALTWTEFKARIREGRGAILRGEVSALSPTYRKQDWEGEHAIYVNEQLTDGSFWAVDPLDQQPLLYPEAELRAYAEALQGVDQIVAGYTRMTPEL